MPSTIASLALTALLSQTAFAGQFVMYTPGNDDTTVQRIDPILAPGHISQHTHQVWGASGLSSNMTYDSLQQSSCTTVAATGDRANAFDNSVYWHPALYAEASDGSGYLRIPTNGHKMYYKDAGSEKDKKREPFEFPHGFRMLAGNPFLRQAPADKSLQNITQWICHDKSGSNQGTDGGFPNGVKNCSAVDGLNGAIHFPHCWNEQDFDPTNPTAHVVYPTGNIQDGACPSSHPIRLPHIFIENTFDVDKVYGKIKQDTFVLAQGDNTGYGWHADFFNGWIDGAIPGLLASCPYEYYGNEDVGQCTYFKSRSTKASDCKLPTEYVEEVTKPGKSLPGCNPIIKTNPAPKQPVAPINIATDICDAFGSATSLLGGILGGSSTAASTSATTSPSTTTTSSPSTTAAASSATTTAADSPPAYTAPSLPTSDFHIVPTQALSIAIHTTATTPPPQFNAHTTFATRVSSVVDSASPSSSGASASSTPACPAGNGTTYTTHGKSFVLECGIDHNGGDLSSKSVSCFEECISLCATTSGCVDVSYMGDGCYLKKTLGSASNNKIVNGARLVTDSASATSSSAPAVTSPPSYQNFEDNMVRVTEYNTVTTAVTQYVHRRHGHRNNGYDF